MAVFRGCFFAGRLSFGAIGDENAGYVFTARIRSVNQLFVRNVGGRLRGKEDPHPSPLPGGEGIRSEVALARMDIPLQTSSARLYPDARAIMFERVGAIDPPALEHPATRTDYHQGSDDQSSASANEVDASAR